MEQDQFDLEDLRFLKKELLFRMFVQNSIIILNAIVFLAVATIQVHEVRHASATGTIFVLFSCILSAIWCHHGARQAQIKCYLLTLHARYNSSEGWEQWLPLNHVDGLLGSRWFISTKATFIASAAISCVIGVLIDPSPDDWICGIAGMGAILAMAALLLTNPKEGLSSAEVMPPPQTQGHSKHRTFPTDAYEQQEYTRLQQE